MEAFNKYVNNDYEVSLQFGVPPCPVCGKIIKDDDRSVQCYKKCKRWFHKDCINLRYSIYMKYDDKVKLRWSCERVECKGAEPEDEFEEWAAMRNAELLEGKNRVITLKDDNVYPNILHDEELSPLHRSEKEKKHKESIFDHRTTTQDRELLSSIQQHIIDYANNELVNSFNKYDKKDKGSRDKRKNDSNFGMDTIRRLFTKSEKTRSKYYTVKDSTKR